ncbi:MAG: hypothetical protein ACREHD_01490 [Pirellulales bacterium]
MSPVFASRLKIRFFSVALLVVSLSGCATTTTASVQSTMHSAESFRFQSCDVTALVQVEFKRN